MDGRHGWFAGAQLFCFCCVPVIGATSGLGLWFGLSKALDLVRCVLALLSRVRVDLCGLLIRMGGRVYEIFDICFLSSFETTMAH